MLYLLIMFYLLFVSLFCKKYNFGLNFDIMIFFSSNIFYKICQNKDFFFWKFNFLRRFRIYWRILFFRIYWRSIEFYIKISILFFSYKHLKKISKYEIIYLINQKDETASAIGVSYVSNYIYIPRSIKYESKEYVVTSVSNCAFTSQLRIKLIKFGQDSEIWMIESNALAISKVEQFYLPASVIELKEGWCRYTVDLKQVEIDPRNPRYSDIKNDGYDIFVFAVRDITEALIPSYIKIIGLHAFNYCTKLQKPWISTKFWTSNHLQRSFCKFNRDSQSHNPSSCQAHLWRRLFIMHKY